MTLLPIHRLQELIHTYPGLTEERRQLLVEFLECSGPERIEAVLESPDLEERAFMHACFGITDMPRLLPELTPTEQPLMSTHHL